MRRFATQLVRRYFRHGVGTLAAALAFYLLFTIFPFLIFCSSLLGLLEVDTAAMLRLLDDVAPREAVELAETYLHHVRLHPSPALAAFALVFSLWFPTRTANALLRAVRTAYHLGPPRGRLLHGAKALFYTVLLLVTLAFTLTALSVTKEHLLSLAARLGFPSAIASLWEMLRVPAAGAVGGFALCALYVLAQDHLPPWRRVWPGAAFALLGWLGISWCYSTYVENFANYPALYGSIGTVIVVLIWLNLTAVMLILGAEVNGILMNWNKREREDNV